MGLFNNKSSRIAKHRNIYKCIYIIHIKIAIILSLSCNIVSAKIVDSEGGPQVEIFNGVLQGRWIHLESNTTGHSHVGGQKSFAAFEGIPYAKIPARFQPPEIPANWTGILNATSPGPVCPQLDVAAGQYYDTTEDCLFANVYVPEPELTSRNGSGIPQPLPLATMVWFHGGGFFTQAGSFYGPNYLMEGNSNVILVTFNYRLGALGFLNTGQLQMDEVVDGNMGLKDMILLLKWVQLNIAAFGGNPKNVTIFGESAGGAAVHAMLLSPATKGLFQQVTAQSGCLLNPWAFDARPKEVALKFAGELNCTDQTTIHKCLMGKSIRDILDAQQRSMILTYTLHVPFGPTVDVDAKDFSVLPKMPRELIMEPSNAYSDIPLIIGWNAEEGRWLAGLKLLLFQDLFDELRNDWNSTLPELVMFEKYLGNCATKGSRQNYDCETAKNLVSSEINKFYFHGETNLTLDNHLDTLSTLVTDFDWFWGIKQSAMLHVQNKGQVYPYILHYTGNYSMADDYGLPRNGPSHGDELQYLLEANMQSYGGWPQLIKYTKDKQFSLDFVQLWTTFAKEGKNSLLAREWKPAAVDSKELNPSLEWFRLNSTTSSRNESDDLLSRFEFWRTVFHLFEGE